MPELPEVETVRRGLEPVMAGARFVRVAQRRADLRFALPARFAQRLKGRQVLRLGRRAKYLLASIEGGEVLLMHLGMSGRFRVRAARSRPSRREPQLGEFTHDTGDDPAHDHVVFWLSNGAVVTYNDPRRFGCMDLIPECDLDTHRLLARLGVEPLGNAFSADYLAGRARGRTADLKAFLMDQRVVAGLGNIYACEALFRAGLSPVRAAHSLARENGMPSPRAERLVAAIRVVLETAIAAGGSTLRDYRRADGSLGDFQHVFEVYGREGEPCVRPGCQGMVRRRVQAGRSTFSCGSCQR